MEKSTFRKILIKIRVPGPKSAHFLRPPARTHWLPTVALLATVGSHGQVQFCWQEAHGERHAANHIGGAPQRRIAVQWQPRQRFLSSAKTRSQEAEFRPLILNKISKNPGISQAGGHKKWADFGRGTLILIKFRRNPEISSTPYFESNFEKSGYKPNRQTTSCRMLHPRDDWSAMKMLWLLCRTSCKIIAGAARRAHSARRTPFFSRRRGQLRPCWPLFYRVSALERAGGWIQLPM